MRSGTGPEAHIRIPPLSIISDYSSRKDEAFHLQLKSIGNVDINKFNPLSKVVSGNPWAAQYDNLNRVNEIKLDVDRTYQEIPFFRSSDVQSSLINILFVFGKSNNMPYRQGMNELCAIIFHVVSDGMGALDEIPGDHPPSDIKEAVAYSIFDSLMRKVGIADFFYSHTVVDLSPQDEKGKSPLLDRCDKIFDFLCQKDGRLHKHLTVSDISPNLFLLRWVRVLFSREFSFEKTLLIWDFLFERFPLEKPLGFPCAIDCFAVAMLLNIRQSLLESDNSGCFGLLLKYPEPTNLEHLFNLAIKVIDGDSVAMQAPPILQPIATVTRRDRAIADLASVIEGLRNSEVSRSINREIGRLEDLLNFLRTGAGSAK